MSRGMLAHVVTAGPEVLGVPRWVLVYAIVAVVAIVAFGLRSTLARAASARSTTDTDGDADGDAGGDAERGAATSLARVAQATGGATLLLLLALAWLGPDQQGSSLIPAVVFSVFWAGSAWLALATGGRASDWSPFAFIADLGTAAAARRVRRRATAAPHDTPGPAHAAPDEPEVGSAAEGLDFEATSERAAWWWVAPVVLCGFLFAWVADPDGSQPRRLAWLLSAYTVTVGVAAWRGGHRVRTRCDPFPVAANLAAWVRPRRRDTDAATQLGVVALVIGAVVFARVSGTESFGRWIGRRSLHAAQVQNLLGLLWISALVAAVIWGLGILTARLAEGGGDSTAVGTTPGLQAVAVGAPIAAGMLLASTLRELLVQLQNVAVLASDPFARGWNLFGTIGWHVTQDPLSPATLGWVQFALIAAAHAAALVALRDRTCALAASGTGSARRAWRAMAPGIGVIGLSGVGCTLGLLGF